MSYLDDEAANRYAAYAYLAQYMIRKKIFDGSCQTAHANEFVKSTEISFRTKED